MVYFITKERGRSLFEKGENAFLLYKTAFWGALGKGDTMKREDGESMSEVVSVSEMFGKDVLMMRDERPSA